MTEANLFVALSEKLKRNQLALILSAISAIDPSAIAEADAEDAEEGYKLRNQMVFIALGCAAHLGYPAGVAIDPNEPDWPVAYIELPTGQVSWHVPAHPTPFDGHDTAAKTGRIRAFAEGDLS